MRYQCVGTNDTRYLLCVIDGDAIQASVAVLTMHPPARPSINAGLIAPGAKLLSGYNLLSLALCGSPLWFRQRGFQCCVQFPRTRCRACVISLVGSTRFEYRLLGICHS
jgi:hypothetical protein